MPASCARCKARLGRDRDPFSSSSQSVTGILIEFPSSHWRKPGSPIFRTNQIYTISDVSKGLHQWEACKTHDQRSNCGPAPKALHNISRCIYTTPEGFPTFLQHFLGISYADHPPAGVQSIGFLGFRTPICVLFLTFRRLFGAPQWTSIRP